MKNNREKISLLNWPKFPLLRVLLFFIIGILIGNTYNLSCRTSLSFAGVLTVFTIICNHYVSGKRLLANVVSLLIFLTIVAYGILAICIQKPQNQPLHYSHHIPGEYMIVGRIIEDLKKSKSVSTLLDVIQVDGKISKGKLLLYFNKKDSIIEYTVGDIIAVDGRIIPTFKNKNPKSFDYSRYLKYNKIEYQIFVPHQAHILIKNRTLNFPYNYAYDIRKWALGVFQRRLSDEQHLATASAMVLGYRETISKELYAAFSETGAVHILAVSGLHVGIICLIFSLLLGLIKSDTKKVKWFKLLVLLMVTWSYTLITGATPAVLRAALMFSFFLFGTFFRDGSNTYSLLATSALVLLIFNPYYLFHAGFQFSYLALISIVYFQPKISNIYNAKSKVGHKLWTLVSVSFAAQILVFPISIFYFHKFPTYFILSGVASVFLATFILGLGLLLLIFDQVPVLGDIIACVYQYLLDVFIGIVYGIKLLPFHSIDGVWISLGSMIWIYIIIVSVMYLVSLAQTKMEETIKPNYIKRRASHIILTIALVGLVYNNIIKTQQTIGNNQLIMYDYNGGSIIDIFNGKSRYTIQSDNIDSNKVKFTASDYRLFMGSNKNDIIELNKKSNKGNFCTDQNGQLLYNGAKFLFASAIKMQDSFPQNSDVLVLSHQTEILPYSFLDYHTTGKVIIDSSISYANANKWKKECNKRSVPVHYIREDGVYLLLTE
ncbi:MAG: ComEC/Rec2 family competence protein [Saprospiraceae bacterium]